MNISPLYTNLPENSEQLLKRSIEKGLAQGKGEAQMFFRADDIGVPGKQFARLIQLFQEYKLPLCMAVVPTWLSTTRFSILQRLTGKNSSQWCWHQHGWLHRNHETEGKKQEFGPGRSSAEQFADLKNGHKRLTDLMGEAFAPYFTPPWNRCSIDTLKGLQQLNFMAISRSKNAKPPSLANLPDFQVNIDLHTRKEPDPTHSLENLLLELELGVSSGCGGIMIHHQRMDHASFVFLEQLLKVIAAKRSLHPVHFQEMVLP